MTTQRTHQEKHTFGKEKKNNKQINKMINKIYYVYGMITWLTALVFWIINLINDNITYMWFSVAFMNLGSLIMIIFGDKINK